MRYITVEDLSFYYDKEPVLEHINYSVDSGEFVTLTGEMEPPRRLLSRPVLVFYNQDMAKLPFQRPTLVGQN